MKCKVCQMIVFSLKRNYKPKTLFISKKRCFQFKPYKVFDATAVEERQRLLFEMVKLIWR
jgi:hypothetical protein